ncbi:MAG TPA: ester cyclase [Solirubrobacteraceae bacterium]|nr:ester cyclase [Solirubrobacteraceae bacterium]
MAATSTGGAKAAADAAETERVADAYFDALARRDVDAAVALWEPGGREHVRGVVETTAPDGVRAFLRGIVDPLPDMRFEVVEKTVQDDRAAYRWRARGTFAGAPLHGVEATGGRIDLEGVDVLKVRDGRIAANDAIVDGMTLARQIGLVPADGSPAERRMTAVFNRRTRVARRMHAARPEMVADGVWLLRGGFPGRTTNVYLVRDAHPGTGREGVLVFDAGIRAMAREVAAAAAQLGGITRVVLGHAHPDHRGSAPYLDAPVLCHPADRADAEGDGGDHYFRRERLRPFARPVFPRLRRAWDGGPVTIAGTVEEGDELAGFEVVHLPGHAPGMIALWRETDRVALTSDCFYTLDPQTGRKGPPRVPHDAFNLDTEQARASIRKLASLRPFAAFPGHAEPLKGDVREQLERAAATT